jgi:hypothetical protein
MRKLSFVATKPRSTPDFLGSESKFEVNTPDGPVSLVMLKFEQSCPELYMKARLKILTDALGENAVVILMQEGWNIEVYEETP